MVTTRKVRLPGAIPVVESSLMWAGVVMLPGDTFFLMADETPTTAIELIAKRIFELHTKDAKFDPAKSGAEWWAQYIEEEDDIGVSLGG